MCFVVPNDIFCELYSYQHLGEMMTLGANDGAVSVSFIEGITLEGLLGHTGMILDEQTLSLTSKISRIILQLHKTFR